MQPQPERDAKTLVIVRAMLIFVVALVLAGLVVLGASLLGVTGLEPWVVVVVAAGGLLATRFLLRHRHDTE